MKIFLTTNTNCTTLYAFMYFNSCLFVFPIMLNMYSIISCLHFQNFYIKELPPSCINHMGLQFDLLIHNYNIGMCDSMHTGECRVVTWVYLLHMFHIHYKHPFVNGKGLMVSGVICSKTFYKEWVGVWIIQCTSKEQYHSLLYKPIGYVFVYIILLCIIYYRLIFLFKLS